MADLAETLLRFAREAPVVTGAALGGIFATFGAFLAGMIDLIDRWRQRCWDEKKWHMDKKDDAFLKCLELLSASRLAGNPHDGGKTIPVWLFRGRMQTLKDVIPWMTRAATLSSGKTECEINQATNEILKKTIAIDRSIRERGISEDDNISEVDDCGLGQAIENVIRTVREAARKELKR